MDDFERADLAAQYAKVNAKIEQLTEVKELLRTRLLEDGVGTREAGNLRVQVSENKRLNAKKFAEKYPAEDFAAFYKTVPDAARAKVLDDPEVYDQVGFVVKVVD